MSNDCSISLLLQRNISQLSNVTNTMAKPYRGVKRFDHYYSPDNTRYNSINVLEGDSGVILTLLNEDKVLNNILLLNNEF